MVQIISQIDKMIIQRYNDFQEFLVDIINNQIIYLKSTVSNLNGKEDN